MPRLHVCRESATPGPICSASLHGSSCITAERLYEPSNPRRPSSDHVITARLGLSRPSPASRPGFRSAPQDLDSPGLASRSRAPGTASPLTMPHPAPVHTYDASCRLVPRSQPASRHDDRPPVLARFFYSAPSSIDDPLSSGDLSAATPDARNSKAQYRPFSADDNYALETAWLGLSSSDDRQAHQEARELRKSRPTLSEGYTARLSALVRHLAARHRDIHGPDYLLEDPTTVGRPSLDGPELAVSVCCRGLYNDVEAEISQSFCANARDRQSPLSLPNVIGAVMEEFKRSRVPPPSQVLSPARPGSASSDISRPLGGPSGAEDHKRADKASGPQSPSQQHPSFPIAISGRSAPADDGITGTPFIRASSPISSPASGPGSAPRPRAPTNATQPQTESSSRRTQQQTTAAQSPFETPLRSQPHSTSADVVVGVSRLHMVSLPALRMQPIYWSPVNDNAAAMRATWFYRYGFQRGSDATAMTNID